ncbi:MAG: class I SAM-dependent methyltransferase [Ignavibacteriaceae bacterium]
MEWFEDWFNTDEYLYVYQHRNETDAGQLAELILQNTNLPPFSPVLDMACGAGRHSVIFAKHGCYVTAVDLSRNLLNVAKKAASEAGVKINFLRSDLRFFSIDTTFDLIVNLFTSFGYFEQDEENFKLLINAYNHLSLSGYFVFDYFNISCIKKNLIPESVKEIPGGKIIQQRSISGNRLIKKITIIKNMHEKQYMESVRMYSCNELKNKMKEIGFDIIKTFGDFNGNTFNEETSPRVIIIARRSG